MGVARIARVGLRTAALVGVLWAAATCAHAAEDLDGRTFYFGELHAHTGMSGDGGSADLGNCDKPGGCGNFADWFDTARYLAQLDFCAVTDHINGFFGMEQYQWEDVVALAQAADDPDNGFVAILGAELWINLPDETRLGHKNFYFFGDTEDWSDILLEDLAAGEEPTDVSCAELWTEVQALDAQHGPLLLLPHHPASSKPSPTVWECHDERWSPVVEIYSSHGNSQDDKTEYDVPYWGLEPGHSVNQALSHSGHGYRLGIVGGTDYHDSWPGLICHLDLVRPEQIYGGSVTGVFLQTGESFHRMAIHDALAARHTIATTGPQIPAILTLRSQGGAELAAAGDAVETLPAGPYTLQVRVPDDVDPYVLGVELYDSFGSTVAVPRVAAGRHELELPSITAPWFAYATVNLDGALWWADVGMPCFDGGADTVEKIWTSPIWLDVADTVDDDGDGYSEAEGDCDDTDDTVYPDAEELPNGVDDDCDGLVDEGTAAEDLDGDGWSGADGDCNDDDPAVYPGAPVLCDDVLDNDCDGEPDPGERDEDGDGITGCEGDCDDTDENVYPGAEDICDGVSDNDCDHHPDPLEVDNDEDGYSECEGDCDDERWWVYPAAYEYQNEIDDDCDGEIDEGFEEDTGCHAFDNGLPFCAVSARRGARPGLLALLTLAAALAVRRHR